jgi:hypothetical protein
MKKKIAFLEKHFGNHSEAARALGITPRHYRRIRKSGALIPPPLQNLITIQVEILKKGKLKVP